MSRTKYNAVKTEVDGIVFDSKKEATRYKELVLLQKAGEIKRLILQPKFVLQEGFSVDGKRYREISYVADFMYTDKDGTKVIEDTKGFRTDVYAIKKKLFLKKYCMDGTRFVES